MGNFPSKRNDRTLTEPIDKRTEARNIVTAFFKEVENKTEIVIPKEIEDIAELVIEKFYFETEQEMINFVRRLIRLYKQNLSVFTEESQYLDESCKYFIDTMLHDLFLVTEGKGIGVVLWAYVPAIWSHISVLKDMRKPRKSKMVRAKDMFVLLEMYKNVYEYAILFLSEFAFIIAEKKKNQFHVCKDYFDEISEERRGGRSARKGRLIWFFEKQRYFKKGECAVIYESYFRDKTAHAQAFFSESDQIFIIGQKRVSIDEFRDQFNDLFRFYAYFILAYLDKSKSTDFILNLDLALKSLKKKTSQKRIK
jgi:hypothetical protein